MASADRMVSVQNPFYIQAANDTARADSVHKLGIAYNQSFCIYGQRNVVMILKQLFHVSSSMNWLLAHTLPFICSGLLFSFIGCILYDSVAIYFFN